MNRKFARQIREPPDGLAIHAHLVAPWLTGNTNGSRVTPVGLEVAPYQVAVLTGSDQPVCDRRSE